MKHVVFFLTLILALAAPCWAQTPVVMSGDCTTASTGVITCTPPLGRGLSRGTELAPAFAASPVYTSSHWTEGAGSMAISYTGANSFAPTTALTVVSGTTYQVTVTFSAYTSGAFHVTIGNTSSASITPTATGVCVFFLTASDATNLIAAADSSGAQVYTVASISVKSVPNINLIAWTNTGLAVQADVYPPAVSTGRTFLAYAEAAYAIVLHAAGSDKFRPAATDYTMLTMGAAEATTATIQGMGTANRWRVPGQNGSLTGS